MDGLPSKISEDEQKQRCSVNFVPYPSFKTWHPQPLPPHNGSGRCQKAIQLAMSCRCFQQGLQGIPGVIKHAKSINQMAISTGKFMKIICNSKIVHGHGCVCVSCRDGVISQFPFKLPESPKSTILSSCSRGSSCILGTCEDQRSPRDTLRVRATCFAGLPRGDLPTIPRMRPVAGIRSGTVVQGHTSREQHLELVLVMKAKERLITTYQKYLPGSKEISCWV